MHLSQPKYIQKVLKRFNMESSHPVQTPLDANQKLDVYSEKDSEEDNSDNKTVFRYQEAIGTILYLSQTTKPDIYFASRALSRYCQNSGRMHVKAVKR